MAEAAVNVISFIFGHEQKHWTNEKLSMLLDLIIKWI